MIGFRRYEHIRYTRVVDLYLLVALTTHNTLVSDFPKQVYFEDR